MNSLLNCQIPFQNQAYDPLLFPERQCLAKRNAKRVLNNCAPNYTAHLLDRYLPLDDDNPNHPCNSRNQRCLVSYSRRCPCECRNPCLNKTSKSIKKHNRVDKSNCAQFISYQYDTCH